MRVIAALRLTPLIVAAALAACGGGGGGGGSGGTSGGGGTNGGGSANSPLAFNDSNAVTASALALRVIEAPGLVAELPLLAALELDRRRVAQYDLPCGGTSVTLRHIDADARAGISAGDSVSADVLGPCNGLASGRITAKLSAVALQTLHIEGAAEFDLVTRSGDRMVGTFTLATSADLTTGLLVFSLTDLALTSTRDGKTDRLSKARFERRFDLDDNYNFDFAGELDSELVGGRYSFSTPVRFTGVFGMLPNTGELVSVAGRTQVKIAVSSVLAERQSTADYLLDTGSGYRPPIAVRWRELTTGLLFYWVPNDPPVISSLEVSPADPPINSTVTAHAVATDPDGNALTFRYSWTVGQSTYQDFGPVFHTGGLRKGDVVSVTVRVSDGRAEVTKSTSFTIANAPPVITSLTIDPQTPRSIEDLTARTTYEDIDGDAVSVVEFEWQRNGVTIPGEIDDVLPHGAFAKGDVVTAIVYVADGGPAVSRQASVTIGDTLPQLTWLSPPGTVAHGAPFSARAVAEDPDGEALPPELRFQLRYGPAGMTVNPTTGAVSWLAGGPMFDRSMKVRYGVGTNIDGAGVVAGELTLEDSDREYPLARSSLDPGRWYSGLRAGDFDADGDAEMLMLTDGGVLYELEAAGSSYRQSWMYPFALDPAPLALATANVDGHPAHEIFITTGNSLLRLDGATRRVTASALLPFDNYFSTCADLETADLDGDGTVELVCSVSLNGYPDSSGDNPLLIIDPVTLVVEGEISGGEFGNDFAVGNVDNDPALEIVTWRGFVFDGVTRQLEWQSAETFPGVAVGDVTGDGIAEIVTCYPNDSGTNGRVYDARSRSVLFELPHLGFTTNLIANIDGTGRAEILMAGSRFAAYRYEPSGSVTTVFYLRLPNDRGATTLAIANVDRAQDARPEFVMGTNAPAIAIADWPTSGIRIEWSTETLEPAIPQTLSGPFYGGELARSPANAPQPLFMTHQTGFRGARLFSMNPATGDLTFSPEIPQGQSFADQGDLAVVDFDRDGTDEAFITVGDFQEYAVGAYEFFAGQLTFRSPPVQPGWRIVDVDHGDFDGDGNDDLVALAEDGSLRVYNALTGAVLFSEQLPPGGRAVVVADLDGSGPPEIIATTWGQVLVYSRANASAPFVRKYESGTFAYTGAMTAGDVDGDGRVEIFLVVSGPGPYVQRFNERLEPGISFPLVDWSPASLLIESSAFGRKNLVGTYSGPTGSQLRVFDAALGEDVWLSPPIHGQFAPNGVHFVDIAGDGVLRIAFGTYSGVFLTR